MSNVHEIIITGKAPFDITTRARAIPAALSFLADLAGPSIGLRIEYLGEPEMRPNDHGGRTAFYSFQITGREAVSSAWIVSSCRRLRRLGVEFSTVIFRDIENGSPWVYKADEIMSEIVLSDEAIENAVIADARART
jgi:hypothetical protein